MSGVNITRNLPKNLQDYFEADEVIDWHHPDVLKLAKQLAFGQITAISIAQRCFEWVRDRIFHSVDYQMNPVTCKASDVLRYETGYCYAKSHLLAALLRANGIPAGFCYQRLSIDDKGALYLSFANLIIPIQLNPRTG